MVFTGIAFMENVDNATLANITALTDPQYFTSGDDFPVPAPFVNLFGYQMIGAAVTRGLITSPELRATNNIEILPIDDAAEPSSAFPIQKQIGNEVVLPATDVLSVETTNSGAVATEQYCLIWLHDGNIAPVTGVAIFHVFATGAITAVADAWTSGQLTIPSDLPVGQYALVGARVEGATLIACRFVFSEGSQRPMVLGYDDEADVEDPIFRNGALGVWGEFQHDRPPQIEILCEAADTTQQLILDVVKVS